ncbi:MAG: hypothetical protein COV72_07385 [Candidatus Omnitrophica bacterium CG11_big_fil_rev_8_21_14_0_20_42_13]|uniref:Uncharacterized protein n=1 Tax=Candidatus Ghiorseimicrobium undicola TaxID=1974746 RepID=A0A2H0LW87_9BACT|nr:MAG: hypothetical protein COV72_07385 [Candidatus Omnitrophica bacterium CG11_big_fil_rev_8_21_14_0_20_42_13]
MRDKKLVLLIILIVAAVASLIYGIATPPKTSYRELPEGKIIVEGQKSVLPENIIPKRRTGKKTIFSSWGRSPFTKKDIMPDAASGELVLNGIIWDDKAPLAIINDQAAGEGQDVAGARIKSILPDKVVVEREGRREILEVNKELSDILSK